MPDFVGGEAVNRTPDTRIFSPLGTLPVDSPTFPNWHEIKVYRFVIFPKIPQKALDCPLKVVL